MLSQYMSKPKNQNDHAAYFRKRLRSKDYNWTMLCFSLHLQKQEVQLLHKKEP